jgi:hypothetical protein
VPRRFARIQKTLREQGALIDNDGLPDPVALQPAKSSWGR